MNGGAVICYAARAYFVKAVVISAHLQTANLADEAVQHHLIDLITEMQHIRGPEYIQFRAKNFAREAFIAIGYDVEKFEE